MRLRQGWRRPLLYACFLLLGVSPGWLRAQSFSLQTGREPIASLDGLWRFHTGDNIAWASSDFDDSQWPLLRSDESWTKQGYPDYGGYAWYRFTIQVPDGSKPLSLLLPTIYTGYQVYANGLLIGSNGSTAPRRAPVFAARPKIFLLPSGRSGPETIQIALRVWEYQPIASWVGGGPYGGGGGAAGDPALLKQWWNLDRNTVALRFVNIYAECILSAIVGLTILVLFLFRQEDREYLWFAVLLLSAAADAVLTISGWDWIPFLLFRFLDQILVGAVVVAALAFFSIVLHTRRTLWWWIACVLAAASPLAVAPYYFQWTAVGISYAIHLCCLLPAYIWIIAALVIGTVRRSARARLLLAPAALLFGFDIVDSIWQICFELGWQTKSRSLDIAILRHPFPLSPAEIINYIFVLALLVFLVRQFSLARQEETRLSTEMEAARGMQSLLVPATAPSTPGFTVESVYLPASEVGGDFFQVLPGGDGSLLIVVGDVSGKGLKAAMTVSTIIGALRNEPSHRPAEILAHLNRVLHGQIGGFVTCCVALVSAEGRVTIANAGHLSPYLNGKELTVAGGLPLGMLAEGKYEEAQYQMASGDRLTFMSDGVVEARNQDGALYGFERTQQISNRSAAAIAETAKQFGQEDDITVVTVERSPVAVHAI